MATCVLCKKELGKFTTAFETSDGQVLCEFCLKKKGIWNRCGGDSTKVGTYVSHRKLVDLLYRDKAIISSSNKQMEATEEAAAPTDIDLVASSMPLSPSSLSTASGRDLEYVVLQVTLKEKFIGTGSKNLTELEAVINAQAAKGYRLHTITTATGNSVGLAGGDRIQATMVFEKIH